MTDIRDLANITLFTSVAELTSVAYSLLKLGISIGLLILLIPALLLSLLVFTCGVHSFFVSGEFSMKGQCADAVFFTVFSSLPYSLHHSFISMASRIFAFFRLLRFWCRLSMTLLLFPATWKKNPKSAYSEGTS
jgi:hypothetical protein